MSGSTVDLECASAHLRLHRHNPRAVQELHAPVIQSRGVGDIEERRRQRTVGPTPAAASEVLRGKGWLLLLAPGVKVRGVALADDCNLIAK